MSSSRRQLPPSEKEKREDDNNSRQETSTGKLPSIPIFDLLERPHSPVSEDEKEKSSETSSDDVHPLFDSGRKRSQSDQAIRESTVGLSAIVHRPTGGSSSSRSSRTSIPQPIDRSRSLARSTRKHTPAARSEDTQEKSDRLLQLLNFDVHQSGQRVLSTSPFEPTTNFTQPGHASLIMGTNFRIPEFNGEKDDDLDMFLQFVEYGFLPMVNTFATEAERNKAKAYLLTSNTGEQSVARKWIKIQPKAIRESFTLLSEALQKRFPTEDSGDLEAAAIENLFKLKQGGKPLHDYFEEAREIKRGLPISLHNELSRRLTLGLDNTITKRIVRAMIPKTENKELEDTIRIIEGADDDDQAPKQEKKQPTDNKYHGLKGTDLALAHVMTEQYRILDEQTRSNADNMRMLINRLSGFNISQPSTSGSYRPAVPPNTTIRNTNAGNGRLGANGNMADRRDIICYRCCQPGHMVPDCRGQEAPREVRERIRGEHRAKLEARDGTNGSSSNNWRVGNAMDNAPLRPQGEMAAQAEVTHKENRPPLGYPLSSHDFGDEDMHINENYLGSIHDSNCAEVYHASHPSQPGEEVEAAIEGQIAGSKRNAREAGLGSAQGPSTLKDTTSTTGRTQVPRRVPRPLRGMGEQDPWNAAGFLRNTVVPISIMQLAHESPRVRAQLADALRLVATSTGRPKTNPNKKAKPRPLEEVSNVEYAQQATNNAQVAEAITQVGPSVESVKPLVTGNFYTEVEAWPQTGNPARYRLTKVLIDAGSTLNLIPERVVKKMNLQITPDSSTSMKVANGDWTVLPGYTHINIEVNGSTKKILVGVVSGDTSYSLLLGRPWLWSVQGVGIYGMSEYWIRDNDGIRRKLDAVHPPRLIPTPQIHVSEEADRANLPYDQHTLRDLDLTQEERIELVLQEIIDQAQDEEEYDEEFEEDIDEESGWEPLKVSRL